MAQHSFDFTRVTCALGSHIASGFADDGITVEYTEDRWLPSTGADGGFTRSKSNNKEGTFILALQAASVTNDVLASYAKQDELAGTGVFPVLIKDLNGRTVASATEAYVVGIPSTALGREAGTREWRVYTGNLDLFVGGFN